MTIAPIARKGALSLLCLISFALLPATSQAQDLAASMEAASKAAAAARAAAASALNAAKAAGGKNLAREAVQQALRAAEAAKEAAEASEKTLAAARAAAESEAPSGGTAVATAAPATQTVAAAGDAPYEGHVQCEGKSCKVDLWMIRGFRAFSQCQVCHGLDGNGSSFAPSLVAKLKEIDHARFVKVVTEGYKGQVGVMPPWAENPNVMKYMDQLYGYMKARSDGVLPAGRLKRYDR